MSVGMKNSKERLKTELRISSRKQNKMTTNGKWEKTLGKTR
jgi:hypothetical protein